MLDFDAASSAVIEACFRMFKAFVDVGSFGSWKRVIGSRNFGYLKFISENGYVSFGFILGERVC